MTSDGEMIESVMRKGMAREAAYDVRECGGKFGRTEVPFTITITETEGH